MRLNDLSLPQPTRRRLLVGGGVGFGLIVAWGIWPRRYDPNLVAGPGEHILGPYVKIAEDGRVLIAIPQVETGQGVFTTLAQIVADEVGADWRTIAVEPAPINPLYANRLFADELTGGMASGLKSFAGEFATRSATMVTGGSSSIRMFEAPMRQAGALARALLCQAAGARWDVAAEACDTEAGFVVYQGKKIRFAELAVDAAALKAPVRAPLRMTDREALTGRSVPRLDTPAKLDGSANFTADVRLPDMVFAAIRQGPIGESRLLSSDKAAADRVRGVLQIVETPRWVAAVANNSWAAERALTAMRPRFETRGGLVDDASIAAALDRAMRGAGDRIMERGELSAAFRGSTVHTARYGVAAAAHASLEPVTATGFWSEERLDLWLPTIAPEAARQTAAATLGIDPGRVTVHSMFVGGGFGRGLRSEAVAQVAVLAQRLKRPVQLSWSREEDIVHDRFRPPALAELSGKVSGGRIEALLTRIAAPAYGQAVAAALLPTAEIARSLADRAADGFSVAGGETSYPVEHLAVDHHPAEVGVPIGYWRSAAHSYTCFFAESFVDELARVASSDPFSFRMGMLGQNARLARCLSTATALAGWQGGEAGTGQGIAVHAAHGSYIAVVAEGHAEGGRVRCDRLVAVADVGRMINPEIVRQQVEGGLIFGLAGAIGCAPAFESGLTKARRLGGLNLPRLANCPDITIELLPSAAESGGASELAVPPVAPALANALFAATGRRFRRLPIQLGAA